MYLSNVNLLASSDSDDGTNRTEQIMQSVEGGGGRVWRAAIGYESLGSKASPQDTLACIKNELLLRLYYENEMNYYYYY